MTNTYFDLIDQTFYFPQEGFDIENKSLVFNGVPLKYLIEKYGTPLKLTYLPKIGSQIKKARNLFTRAMNSQGYRGQYYYCYCTKSSHFSYVINEVLKHDVHLETSSAFDIDLIRKLHRSKRITKKTIIVCNGLKNEAYLTKITALINDGFESIGSSDTNHSVFSMYSSWLMYVEYCKKNNLTENIITFLLDYNR